MKMDSFLLCSVLIALMLVGEGRGISMSKSCSYVNGVQRCTEESGSGNMAMSGSMAGSGPGFNGFSSDFASTGDSGTGRFDSSRITSGNVPAGVQQGVFTMGGGFPGGGAGAGAFAGAGGFAGGFPGPVGPPLPMNPFEFVFGRGGGGFPFGRR